MFAMLTGNHPFYQFNDNEESYINRIAHLDLEANLILQESA